MQKNISRDDLRKPGRRGMGWARISPAGGFRTRSGVAAQRLYVVDKCEVRADKWPTGWSKCRKWAAASPGCTRDDL